MRTTLTIDDDILLAAKELASAQSMTAGKVLSDLARQGFRARAVPQFDVQRSGVPILPRRGKVMTPHQIQDLMDEEGI